jgi:hypothetical protein
LGRGPTNYSLSQRVCGTPERADQVEGRMSVYSQRRTPPHGPGPIRIFREFAYFVSCSLLFFFCIFSVCFSISDSKIVMTQKFQFQKSSNKNKFKSCSNLLGSKIVQIWKKFRFEICSKLKFSKYLNLKILKFEKYSELKFVQIWKVFRIEIYSNFEKCSDSKFVQILKIVQIWNLLQFKNYST